MSRFVFAVALLCALPFAAHAIAGCDGTVAPGTPTNLQATAGDVTVDLTWQAGNKDACLDYYKIFYFQQGPTGDRDQKKIERQTKETKITLKDVQNGFVYAITVEAVKNGMNRTQPAGVKAVPVRPCDSSTSPGAAREVTAYNTEGNNVKLCWSPPLNGGCVDEYRLAYRIVPLTDDEARQSRWSYETVQTAGCITFKNLQDRRSYQFAVQTYSRSARSGSTVAASATVVANWRCMPVPGYYPLCESAATGACNPKSCTEQVNSGQCDAPWLRQLDRSTKTVVQYCSNECGCRVELEEPANGQSKPEPKVSKMSGYDNVNGCCKY